jgi:hypothetical protein
VLKYASVNQGLALVHFSAQLEQCLTQENTLPYTLYTPPNTQFVLVYTIPTRTPYPIQSAQVELKSRRM